MSDPISPTGSPGPSPPAAAYAAAQAESVQGAVRSTTTTATPTTVASASGKAIQEAAATAQAATKLELSTASGVNPVTNKVIRQLPPEEVVQQARNLRMADSQGHSGILLDKSL